MTLVQTILSPLRPAVATLLSPASICSVYSLGAAILIAFAWLVWRRKSRGRPVAPRTLMRAIFSRRVLLHRSTFADLAYCVLGLAAFGRASRLGGSVHLMDQRRRRCASDARLRPRAALARSRLGAQRHADARAFSRLRAWLLRRPHAQAPHSRALGTAQGASLGRSVDAAGQLPRSPAQFAGACEQSRSVHRNHRRRRAIRAGAQGGVLHPVRPERA